MKHQAKQSLAWLIAIAASSGLYGGGAWWMKHTAAHHEDGSHSAHEAKSEHGHEAAHGEEGTGESGDHDGGHDTASHDSHNEAGGEHATAESEHKEHGNEHAVTDEHPKEHGEHHAETAEQNASEHGEKKELHAEAAGHHKAKEHEEHHAETSEHKVKGEHLAATAEHKKAGPKEKNEHHEGSKANDAKGHDSHGNGAPHWSYAKADATGPAHWGDLIEQFSQCEKGREQSPIDLKGAVSSASAPQITWHYDPTAVNVENNGHTVMASMPNTQNHIMISGEKYTLAQFHFHNPSEHKVSGILSEMELHLVHKNDKGGLAVIGVMIQEKAGQENPFITPLWNVLPRELSSKAKETPTMNLTKLLPIHRDYFSYAGSLTTPPCSQGVRWFVMKEPIYFNGSQVERYTGIFGGPTNRPVQPLFGREIIQSSGPATVGH